jgi:hypothetical protein
VVDHVDLRCGDGFRCASLNQGLLDPKLSFFRDVCTESISTSFQAPACVEARHAMSDMTWMWIKIL